MSFDAAIQHMRAEVHKSIAETARRAHAAVMATDPRPINFVRHVDGVAGAPETAVKPDGVIVYDYNRLDLVAAVALDLLRQNSPVTSGEYVRGHVLYLDGQPVNDLRGWSPGNEIAITNYVPYARVIELGTRGGKRLRLSVPPHVYERVAQMLRRSYGSYADIRFTYRGIVAGAQVNPRAVGAGIRSRNKAEARFPTITIGPPGSFGQRGGRA